MIPSVALFAFLTLASSVYSDVPIQRRLRKFEQASATTTVSNEEQQQHRHLQIPLDSPTVSPVPTPLDTAVPSSSPVGTLEPTPTPSPIPSAVEGKIPFPVEFPVVLPVTLPVVAPITISAPVPVAGSIIRINAGAAEALVDQQGIKWLPDTYSINGGTWDACNGKLSVYCSEKYSLDGKVLTYTIPELTAGGKYTVKLYFAENYFKAVGERVFDVVVQDKVVLEKLDIVAKVEFGLPFISETIVTLPSTATTLKIELKNVVENAKISAIEIIPITATVPVVPPVAAPVAGPIVSDATLLSAPIRINAGSTAPWTDESSKITWMADSYFNGGTAFGSNTCPIDIDGTEVDNLLCTERFFFAVTKEEVHKAYVIPIKPGRYVIKLLIAETFFAEAKQRVFNVLINDKVILKKLDLVDSVGKDSPYIISRYVTVTAAKPEISIGFVNLVENPKINAIEILPITTGSLEMSKSALPNP
jgi:Malectin domain